MGHRNIDGWDFNFFKQAPKREATDDYGSDSTITVASTTDKRSAVNHAAEHDPRHGVRTAEEGLTVEQWEGSVQAPDGTTEHSPKIYRNGVALTPNPTGPDVDPIYGIAPDFTEQMQAARQVLPDFDETLSKQVAISQVMADTIRALPNAWAVAYDLGKHPQEAAEIMKLPEGQQRRRIVDKSTKLRLKTFGWKKTRCRTGRIGVCVMEGKVHQG